MQIQLEQQCSVKRCVELSPSCKLPPKRSTSELRRFAESSSNQLNFGEAPAQAIQREPMKEANPSFLPLASVLQDETPSMPDASKLIDGDTKEFIRKHTTSCHCRCHKATLPECDCCPKVGHQRLNIRSLSNVMQTLRWLGFI